MDTRWQPTLDHPPCAFDCTPEARALYAAGWQARVDEGWLGRDGHQLRVAAQTWRGLRELHASVPVQVRLQRR